MEGGAHGLKWGGNADVIRVGGKRVSGLARYCNDAGKWNNVVFAPKPNRAHTWGVKVMSGKRILPGEEIFVGYGHVYWKSTAADDKLANALMKEEHS